MKRMNEKKEQKGIAEWIGKTRTLDFERWAIKNPKIILKNCVKLCVQTLYLSTTRNTLKDFIKFVIYSTDPDGTNEVEVLFSKGSYGNTDFR